MVAALVVRLLTYLSLPHNINNDEFEWGWAGQSLLLHGHPSSWSYLAGYPPGGGVMANPVTHALLPWQPRWVDHPPLFAALVGVVRARRRGDGAVGRVAGGDPARPRALQRGLRRPPLPPGAPPPRPAGGRAGGAAARVHAGGGDRLGARRGGVAARGAAARGAPPGAAAATGSASACLLAHLPAGAARQGDGRARGGFGVPAAPGGEPLAAGHPRRRRRRGGRRPGGRLGGDRRLAGVRRHHAGAVRAPRHAVKPARRSS